MMGALAQPLESLVTGRIGLILVIAFAVSTAISAITAFTLSQSRFAGLGHAGVAAGFLTGFILFLGLPPVLSGEPLHILPYVVLIGLIAGIVVDSVASLEQARLAAVLAWPGFVVVAIGWREMPDFATFAGLPMALLWLAAVLSHLWLGSEHRSPTTPVIALFAVVVGLGITAHLGGSRIITVLSTILAVAFIGFLAWNYPRPKFLFGTTAMLGSGGAVLALAVALVLYTNASALAAASLLLVFALAPLAARLPFGSGAKAGPIVLLAVSAIPVAIAAVLALNGI